MRMKNAGLALMVVLLLLLLIAPIAIVLQRLATQSMRATVADQQRRMAGETAHGALMDFFHAFTQAPYADHFGNALLDRDGWKTLAGGTAHALTTPDRLNHSIVIDVTGKTMAPSSRQKGIRALVKMQSHLTRFLLHKIDSPFQPGANLYTGPMYLSDISLGAPNVRFVGGPVIVKGNIDVLATAGGSRMDCDLYLGGTLTTAVPFPITGHVYHYAPDIPRPTIDVDFYRMVCSSRTTIDRKIRFNDDDTFQSASRVGAAWSGWSTKVTIPPEGAIILGEDCNLWVGGHVSRPVTVVATAASYTINRGSITVYADLKYQRNGVASTNASMNGSLALIATNLISFVEEPVGAIQPGDLTVCAALYIQNPTAGMPVVDLNVPLGADTYRFYGTRWNKFTFAAGLNGYTSSIYTFDPSLSSYPPPGLPEHAVLVNWSFKE